MSTVIGDQDSGWVSVTTDQLNDRVGNALGVAHVGEDPDRDKISVPCKEDLERLNYQGKEVGKSFRNLSTTSQWLERQSLTGVSGGTVITTIPPIYNPDNKSPCPWCDQENPDHAIGRCTNNKSSGLSDPSKTATSPKSLDSSHKVPVNLCPASAIIAIAMVISLGHKKPGRTKYNWRSQPISYSEYHAAALRHLLKSNDGSDMDPELSELAGVSIRHDWAAMSCLAIIEDARQAGTLVDDRPVKGGAEEFLEKLTVKK